MFGSEDLINSGEVGSGLPSSFWHVAYTQPKREQLATDNLVRQGFDSYLPLYRKLQKYRPKSSSVVEPMFPRYTFFRPGAGQSLSAARSTRGVAFVLSFGCRLAVLKDEALEAIRDFECLRNLVDVNQFNPISTGAKVRLARENLYGIEGLVTSVSGKRVNVLIEILGGYRKMSVEHHQLELV